MMDYRTSRRKAPGFDGRVGSSLSQRGVFERLYHKLRRGEKGVPQPLVQLISGVDVSHASPRQMRQLCDGLHKLNLISDTEFYRLSFQPEIHPEYNATIGQYRGVPAQPDGARDFLKEWENKMEDDRKNRSIQFAQSARIYLVLLHVSRLRQAQLSAPHAHTAMAS